MLISLSLSKYFSAPFLAGVNHRWKSRHTWDHTLGLIAGASGVVIGHPFDTLKVFYQINPSKTTFNLNIRTLYRGILPPLLTSGSIQSINFTLYEYFKSKIVCLNYGSGVTMFIAASSSGAMMSIITAPLGMIKIRQQTSRFSQRMPSIPAVVRTIYSTSGITGFYRGASEWLLKFMANIESGRLHPLSLYGIDRSGVLYVRVWPDEGTISDSSLLDDPAMETTGSCDQNHSSRYVE